MKELHVMRRFYAEGFTLGELHSGDNKWHALELPWADNHPDISCIPTGVYKATHHVRHDGLPSLLLADVPGRTEVEIHPGNTTANTHGCILIGKGAYCSLTAAGVSQSDDAMTELLSTLGADPDIVVNVVNYGDLAHDQRPWSDQPETPAP